MQQLPFQFPVQTRYQLEDFLPGASNDAALRAVQQWAAEPAGAVLLRGPQASGKSHLASIWAREVGAAILSASALTQTQTPQAILQRYPALVVEDIEQLPASELLFHLLNHLKQHPAPLLLTVAEEACWAHFTLPDLRSRLQALPQATIHPPDEALLHAVLVKQFADRQLTIHPDVPDYLIRRAERSFAAIRTLVAKLDALASSRKKPITIALVREVLNIG
jgi:DnaA regulatory inactivator Hda